MAEGHFKTKATQDLFSCETIMDVRKTTLCVVAGSALLFSKADAVVESQLNYGFIYWEEGMPTSLGGRRPQSQANLVARANPNLVIQTGYYSLRLDCDDLELTGYDALSGSDYLTALTEDVTNFSAAQLRLHVYKDGIRYTCSSGIVQDNDDSYVRLIENGQFVQRFDHTALIFTDSGGNDLGVKGRLEVTVWPDRVAFMLDFRDYYGAPLATGITRTTIELNTGSQNHLSDVLDDHVFLAVQPHLDTKHPDSLASDYITEAYDLGSLTALNVSFDQPEHAVKIEVPSSNVQFPQDLDRVDEFLIEVTNPESVAANIPLVFEQPTPRAITGGVMVLCEESGAPTGIPVQMSKNWHKTAGEVHIHQGSWRRGSTVVTLGAGESKRFRLRVIHGHWGGAPAASHAQLSLIGWGTSVNWKWDESALGAWGEHMTFDPTQHAGAAHIADVRPAFTLGYNSGAPYDWTENSGGGDFLIYYDQNNKFRWGKRMKTAYRWYGPNLSEVLYSGVTDDNKIRYTYTTRLPATYDYHRHFHSYQYEFLEDVVSPERLVFHQMAADYYTGPTYDDYAVGNETGLLAGYTSDSGGNTYKGSFAFDDKWLVTEDLIAGSSVANSNRSMLLRKSKLNGADFTPFIHRYGRTWGSPKMLFDLSADSVERSYSAGDVVEGEVEFMMAPKSESVFWGDDSEFAARLGGYSHAWEATHEEFRYNDLNVTAHIGTVAKHYPVEIEAADGYVLADFTINGGGIGHVPIVILNGPKGHPVAVQRFIDGKWAALESVDLSSHDYYQGYQNAAGGIDYAFNIKRPTSDLQESWRIRVIGGNTPDGLVAHCSFDGAPGGVAMDGSGHELHATVSGATWTSGFIGGALEFDASGSVTLPLEAFIGINEQITIAMWVWGDTSQPRADSVFYAKNAAGSRVLNIHLPWSNGNVYWDAGYAGGSYDRINQSVAAGGFMGQWNHWVFTKNASTGEMVAYLNGVPEISGTGKFKAMSGVSEVELGSQTSGSNYDGLIDEVMLYNVALSGAEVAALYGSYRSGYTGWLSAFSGLSDTSFSGDPDQDGLLNGLEYVLNGNPMSVDSGISPQPSISGENYVFTFTRTVESAGDTEQVFQIGSSLADWVDLNITDPKASEVSLGEVIDGLQTVTVTVSQSEVVDGRLFGRLMIISNP